MGKSEKPKDYLEEKGEKGSDNEMPEQKSKGKITDMHIHVLDDGSYHLRSSTNKGNTQETSHPNHKHLMAALHDNLTSPHLPALGSGGRFSALKDSLSHEKGVTNPGALAASIGRKKYGAAKFDALAAAGK